MSIQEVGPRAQKRTVRGVGAVVLSLLVTTALVAGCSSSSKSSSSSSSAATGTSSGAGGDSQVTAAKAAVAKAVVAPTTIPITAPLTTKPTAGKTIVYMKTTDDPSSQGLVDSVTSAAKVVGWNVKTVGFQEANPATLVSGMQQALQLDPVAVVITAEPEVVWQSEVAAYAKAKVAIIAGYVGPLDLVSPIIANVAGPAYEEEMASDIANWFIADSNGKGKALLYNVSELPTLKNFGDPLKTDVKNGCSGCSVSTLVDSIANASSGKSTGAIVSALQRDPSITYLLTDYGAWVAGLRSALNAAGLSKVKIAGSSSLPADLAAVKAGTESAFTEQDSPYAGWAMADAAFRYDQGLPVQDGNSAVPFQLAVTGGDFSTDVTVPTPADYQDQFKKLWKVS